MTNKHYLSITLCAALLIIFIIYNVQSIIQSPGHLQQSLNTHADTIAYHLSETLHADSLKQTDQLTDYLHHLINNTPFHGITLKETNTLVTAGKIEDNSQAISRRLHLNQPLKIQLWSDPINSLTLQRQLNISFITLLISAALIYILFILNRTTTKSDPTNLNGKTSHIRHIQQLEDEIQELQYSKNSLFSNMSIEFRTPLDVIIGYSELLLEENKNISEEQAIHDLQNISIAGKHLHNLLNEISDLEKINKNELKIEIENINIEHVINDILHKLQPLNNRNKNRITCQYNDNIGDIISDKTRLHQIILNMLTNASMHTENGQIKIIIERETKTADSILIHIIDTGIGTPLITLINCIKSLVITQAKNQFTMALDLACQSAGNSVTC